MPDRNTVHHAADAVTAERLTAQADAAAAAGPASHDETTTLLTPDTSAVPRVNDSGRSTSDMVMLCAAMLLGVAGSVLLAVRLRRIFAGVGLDVGRLRPVIASLIPARVGTVGVLCHQVLTGIPTCHSDVPQRRVIQPRFSDPVC
jgi:hypothetical protein